MRTFYIFLLSFFIQLFSLPLAAQFILPEVIYGNDDRYEVSQYPDRLFREKSKSVAAMVKAWHLSENSQNPDVYNIPKVTLKRKIRICADERFVDQIILPYCTGSLVAPDLLVTAGHCVNNKMECKNLKWAFDYVEGTTHIKKSNVYSCKEIFKREVVNEKYVTKDYALIKLDRKVKGRKTLKYRKFGRPNFKTPLVVIGFPSQLPMKIADGATVLGWSKKEKKNWFQTWLKRRFYLAANLDTFVGNSGSPVFNGTTGKIEGILVEGADDYYYDSKSKCLRPKRLKDDKDIVEERVFRINKIPYLKNLKL